MRPLPGDGDETPHTVSTRVRASVGLLVSVVLVGLLLRYVRPADVLDALARADLPLLLAATGLHGVQLLLRVQRFAGLVGEVGVASRAAFDSAFLGWLSNLTLPAKAGELTRPFAYRSWSEATMPCIVASMVVERTLDLILLGALFGGALMLGLPPDVPHWVATAAWVMTTFGVLMVVVLAVLLRGVDPAREDVLGRFRRGLSALGALPSSMAALGLSVGIWGSEVAGVWLTLVALGVTPPGALAASSVLVVATTLAVAAPAAPGGLGVEQWVTVIVLSAWAVTYADAVAVSLLVLFEAVVWIAPLGLIALWRRSIRGERESVDGLELAE